MALIRRIYHLDDYLKDIHFNNLGLLLLVMALLWFYFTFAEFLTTYYGSDPSHLVVFYSKLNGRFAPYFWTMVVTCFIIPVSILGRKKTRTITGCVLASMSVNIGMWLERFTIVVPTLSRPRLPWAAGHYTPHWVEIAITIGFGATFILLYMVFTKFFPIVSIWEVQEGRELAIPEVVERVQSYFPGQGAEELVKLSSAHSTAASDD
jgi:molybdopterin-containing oxidoreductase family membrane subunit